ncbi:MAG: glycosyltransferase involved in cell wall biosynthesis [Paracoccaceae bacterium]|jgi:glycosyltransferase involved in cell wall biosynthesis
MTIAARPTSPDPRPRIAFYAPMKPPDHPVPSGDREIARLTMRALDLAGFAPGLASTLRTLDLYGDRLRQHALMAEADLEVERLLETFRPDPPALWFTYHCYWKAPDLVGPRVASALRIPYVVSEASHSHRRLTGPWSWFAEESLRALRVADLVYWTTPRDRPGLQLALEGTSRPGQRLRQLPAFIDPGPRPARAAAPPDPTGPLRLLSVAMMRPGDKLSSFHSLADALAALDGVDWRLVIIGDGPLRGAVRALFDPFEGRVEFAGRVDDADRLRAAYEASELLVWPGVGEGIGMTYLEAQAAALPCLAEDRPGPRDVVLTDGVLPAAGDPAGFAAQIAHAASDRDALAMRGHAARLHIETRHSIAAAAQRLRADLGALIGATA